MIRRYYPLFILALITISTILGISCRKEAVFPELVVDFVCETENPVAGDSIVFGQRVFGLPVRYKWTFEGGEPDTSSKERLKVIFKRRGEYKVSLEAWNERGDKDSAVKIIKVGTGENSLKADFIASPNVTYPGNNILFQNLSEGIPDPTVFKWFFQGGTPDSSTEKDPIISFQDTGRFDITLIAYNGVAYDTLSKTSYITIQPNDLPFGINCVSGSLTGSAPHEVEFNAIGGDENEDLSYYWTFGDGESSNLKETVYTYRLPGNYVARLNIILGNDTTFNVCTFPITVTNPNNKPTVNCSVVPQKGIAPMEITATGTAVDPDPNGGISDYAWDFGDGNTISGTDSVVQHTYQLAGSYELSLVVTDISGDTAQCQVPILVEQAPLAPTITCILGENEATGVVPHEINVGAVANDPDGEIISYTWDFGDGTIADGQEASHIYTKAGTYNVTCTVLDNDGNKGICTMTIEVQGPNQAPSLTCPSGQIIGSIPFKVTINSEASDPDDAQTSLNYTWDFGNGTTGEGSSPIVTYPNPGTFVVTGIVTDPSGNTDTCSFEVIAEESPNLPPIVFCEATPETGFIIDGNPFEVSFNVQATDPEGGTLTYFWNFGDGNTSTERTPTNAYTAPGIYSVTCTVTDSDGSRTTCNNIVITVKEAETLVINCASNLSNATPDQLIRFTAETQGGIGDVTVVWDFGDNTAGSEINPTHSYTQEGTYQVIATATDEEGNTASCELNIVITSPPLLVNCDATIDPNNALRIFFTSQVENATTDIIYNWTFSDGRTSTQKDPVLTFNRFGTITYSLIVEERTSGKTANCEGEISLIEPPNQAPVASCQANKTSGNAPLTVNFNGSNSSDADGNIVAYQWNFDNNVPNNNNVNASYTFQNPGVYNVALTVTDDDGATDKCTIQITVNEPSNQAPVASCQANKTSGNAPLTVNFNGTNSSDADGNIVAYQWDFNNNVPDNNNANASYTFQNPGVYNVELTVTDDDGATDKCTIQITVNEPPNQAPVANCQANKTSGNAPLTVNFNGSNSSDADGDIVAYQWDFNNNVPDNNNVNASYTFQNPGVYNVELTVTDDDGATDNCTIQITVNEPPNQAPVANCQSNKTSGTVPLTVSFNGSNSSDADGNIVAYQWDFDDGSAIVNNSQPTFTFTEVGVYNVELTVEDDDGATNNCTIQITVNEAPNQPPIVQCDATPKTGPAPLTVEFSGRGTTDPDGSIAKFDWNFGDNKANSTKKNPTRTYDNPGTYNVNLTVTDNDGATENCSLTIVVTEANQAPVASCNANVTSGAAPLEVNFSSAGSIDPDGTIEIYNWDLSNGIVVVNNPSPSFTFTDPGTYPVKLTVIDNEGERDDCIITITVN